MNNISLEKVYESNNSVHVKLFINEKDCGILYLKSDEADLLIECLKRGVNDADAKLSTNIFDSEDDFDSDIDDE
jgi:hypothetical protein